MHKIASPEELKGELRSLLAYAQSPNPSRTVLAQQLNALSQRVASNPLGGPEPTPEQIKVSIRAIKKLEAKGYSPRAYSGRGMYGDYCVGITVDRELANGNSPESKGLRRSFGGASRDSMGMDAILYWRGLPWPPGRQDSDYVEDMSIDSSELERGLNVLEKNHYGELPGVWVLVRENPPGSWEIERVDGGNPRPTATVSERELERTWEKFTNQNATPSR